MAQIIAYDSARDTGSLSFRPFMKEDLDFYLDCYEDAWLSAHGNLNGFNRKSCGEAALLRLKSSPGSVCIARQEDTDAGILALDENRGKDAGIGWIVLFYLIPSCRGQGLGRLLAEEAGRRYKSLGRKYLRLTVAPENPAVGFYSHLGFCKVGTCPGAFETLWIMEKPI